MDKPRRRTTVFDLYHHTQEDVGPWPAGGWLHVSSDTMQQYVETLLLLAVPSRTAHKFLQRETLVLPDECALIGAAWLASGRLCPPTLEWRFAFFVDYIQDALPLGGIDVW